MSAAPRWSAARMGHLKSEQLGCAEPYWRSLAPQPSFTNCIGINSIRPLQKLGKGSGRRFTAHEHNHNSFSTGIGNPFRSQTAIAPMSDPIVNGFANHGYLVSMWCADYWQKAATACL
ncbi:unnamed protein product [Cercospora beticola]|nr:unnamed protein product [Cercospora beticola]